MFLSHGQILGGDFRVGRQIGEGGMGAVYEAEQISTGSRRAIKVMQASVVSQPALRDRFVQEARIGSMINSDHIVQVVAAGVDPHSGAPWLAMELLSGRDLNAALAQRGPFSPGDLREVFAQLCHAVGAAHAAGVVHRDLKPENIFLADSRTQGQQFTVKVLDFGIAKIMDMARSKQTGAMGSQLWMAPEQTQTSDQIGPPTDVWALGLIAYYLLTGRPYWLSAASDAGTAALLRNILIDPLEAASVRAHQLGSPRPLPPGFDAWFAGCVNRDPSQRFANATQCWEALSRTLAPNAMTGPPQLGMAGAATVMASGPSGYDYRVPSQPQAPVVVSAYSQVGSGAEFFASGPPYQAQAQTFQGPGGQTMLGPPVAPVRQSGGIAPVPAKLGRKKSKAPLVAGIVGVAALATAFVLAFIYRDAGSGNRKKQSPEDAGKACAAAFHAPGPADAKAMQSCEAACDSKANPNCRYLADLEGRAGKRDEARAEKLYAKGCDASDEYACQRTMILGERKGTSPDSALAIHQAACDDKRAAACTRSGDIHERRTDKNGSTQAAALYDRACEAGDALGCANLGMMLEAGRRVKRDPAKAGIAFGKAAKGIQAACEEGAGLECVALGYMLETGRGLERDPAKAATHYERACEAGVSEGCTNLGALHALGLGVARDAKKMEELFKRACDAGEKTACNNLGVVYSRIHTTLRSNTRGTTVFKFHCQGMLSVGCSGWATEYEVASGTTANLEEGRRFLQNACEGKEQTACVNFGAVVRHGIGGSVEPDRANDLFKRACDAGNAGGCGELGTMLSHGHGAPLNRVEGKRVLQQACDWGERDACVVNAQMDVFAHDAPSAAMAELKKQCDEGVAAGCSVLADAYNEGTEVPKDQAKGLDLQQRACDGKGMLDRSGEACVGLAFQFINGVGVGQNPAKGYEILRRECQTHDHKQSCAYAATYLVLGTGVPADPTKGSAELNKLCADGVSYACGELANLVLGSKVPGAADAKAFEVSQRGCALGDGNSCAYLALCYATGRGAPAADRVKARTFYDQACRERVAWACTEAQKL